MHEPGSRETALVESGTVVLHCDGARATSSRAGDCVTFDADLPHHFENPGPEEAVLLAVVSAGLTKELGRHAKDPVRQDLGRPRGRPRPAVHRPAPRPRGHQPAGVRRAAAGRPRRSAAPTARSPPPTTTCRPTARRSPRGSRTSSRASRSRRSSATATSSGSRSTRSGSEHQGIVHVIGPELGRHPARHDDRLRRLAHRHPRRVRRAGVRDRDERGRARAGDPVPGPVEAALDADPLRGRARLRRHRQGPDPGHDRPDGRRRRGRPRRRVRRARRSSRCRWRAG